MKNIKQQFTVDCQQAINKCFGLTIALGEISITNTRAEFEGDYTLVAFSLTPLLKKSPQEIASTIGDYLLKNNQISAYNVVKGFLNCSFSPQDWISFLKELDTTQDYGKKPAKEERILVEFSSPNTNKPLHLGHIRNILLGWSTAQMLEEVGYDIKKVQVINDRGIAICKSMLAWQLYGQDSTPESTGVKGDHFVGKYYVKFEEEFTKEYLQWQQSDTAHALINAQNSDSSEEDFFKSYKNTYFNKHSLLGSQAKQMLRKWEDGDAEVLNLWKQMNDWVYQGFDKTYEKLGVSFDKNYFESQTYILGKKIIEQGLSDGSFYQKEDGSVWVDLQDVGMDEKILLRSDGTSVYITQDLGTAHIRYEDYAAERMIYVVADEQNYHFQVLFELAKRMHQPYAAGMYHLSYGMMELPHGRMKSREGTVVDADDLIAIVEQEVESIALEKGEINNLTEDEKRDIISKIALAAIKFFIIKVTPKKKMIFNPSESVDMHGQTGPYVQNAYVRIQSVLHKQDGKITPVSIEEHVSELHPTEKHLLLLLDEYPYTLEEAAENYDPSELANYIYKLAKSYHKFYSECPILSASEGYRDFRIMLSTNVAKVLKKAMNLLGMDMPNKM